MPRLSLLLDCCRTRVGSSAGVKFEGPTGDLHETKCHVSTTLNFFQGSINELPLGFEMLLRMATSISQVHNLRRRVWTVQKVCRMTQALGGVTGSTRAYA